jgi:hypothetical protein
LYLPQIFEMNIIFCSRVQFNLDVRNRSGSIHAALNQRVIIIIVTLSETPCRQASRPRRGPACRRSFGRHAALAALVASGLLGRIDAVSGQEPFVVAPDPLRPPPAALPARSGYLNNTTAQDALFQQPGFRVGDFAILSRATATVAYDDNVEAENEDREDDVFLAFSPSVRAQSLYARHSIGFNAAGTAATALDNDTEDFFDWVVGADGRLDLSRQSNIDAAVAYTRETEDDEAVDAGDETDDTAVNLVNGGVGYNFQGRVVGWRVGSSVSRTDYADSDFDDRDSTTLGLNGSASYRLSDRISLSAGPSYAHSSFDEEVADDGDSRDSERFGFQVGASYQLSRTLGLSGGIGYTALFFDDPDRKDTDSATGNASVNWASGRGTSASLGVSHGLSVSVVDNEDSRATTRGRATVSHVQRLGSRSAVSGSLQFTHSDFSDLDRADQDFVAALGYGYRISEHFFFNAGYRFSQRFSEDEDEEFYRNLFAIGLSVAY